MIGNSTFLACFNYLYKNIENIEVEFVESSDKNVITCTSFSIDSSFNNKNHSLYYSCSIPKPGLFYNYEWSTVGVLLLKLEGETIYVSPTFTVNIPSYPSSYQVIRRQFDIYGIVMYEPVVNSEPEIEKRIITL